MPSAQEKVNSTSTPAPEPPARQTPGADASVAASGPAHRFLGNLPPGPIRWIVGDQPIPPPRSDIFAASAADAPPAWTFDHKAEPSPEELHERLHSVLAVPAAQPILWAPSSGVLPARPSDLLVHWEPHNLRSDTWRLVGSLAIHALVLLLLTLLPGRFFARSSGTELVVAPQQVTPLVEPPIETAQNAGRGLPEARDLNLNSLIAPTSPNPGGRGPSSTGAAAPPQRVLQTPVVPSGPPRPVPQIVEPPSIQPAPVETARNLTPPALGTPAAPTPPAKPPAEKPKLAFEKPGLPGGELGTSGLGAMTRPRPVPSGVGETGQSQVTPSSPGRLVIGDESLPGQGGVAGVLNPQARRDNIASSLAMMTDTKGVDFRPYLIQVLSAVRRNWMAVLPESARLGMRGRVTLQFAISRDGDVPKLVIAVPSGSTPLDRAAVAGVSASNPFPPLPRDFKGGEIRLQMVFSYNIPKQ